MTSRKKPEVNNMLQHARGGPSYTAACNMLRKIWCSLAVWFLRHTRWQ